MAIDLDPGCLVESQTQLLKNYCCPDPKLDPFKENLWGWGSGIRFFKIPQVILLCSQDGELLI